eukprot:Tamp_14658.p2 GENE.Tamp_14658~~Tamp_14658.p2  ORF type:complete len:133 (-),score=29.60 Tamp_14658:893-1291(-)
MLRRKDKLGKRRMRTFKLVDDDIELDDAEENIEDVVKDEMLAPVFFDEQLRDDAGGGLRSHHLRAACARFTALVLCAARRAAAAFCRCLCLCFGLCLRLSARPDARRGVRDRDKGRGRDRSRGRGGSRGRGA